MDRHCSEIALSMEGHCNEIALSMEGYYTEIALGMEGYCSNSQLVGYCSEIALSMDGHLLPSLTPFSDLDVCSGTPMHMASPAHKKIKGPNEMVGPRT